MTKPTKQQVAQGKARAGGNNPIKVTNSGLKKLGKAALVAATMTPVGRAAKVIKTEAIMAKAGFNAAAKESVRKQVARDAFARKNPGKLMSADKVSSNSVKVISKEHSRDIPVKTLGGKTINQAIDKIKKDMREISREKSSPISHVKVKPAAKKAVTKKTPADKKPTKKQINEHYRELNNQWNH